MTLNRRRQLVSTVAVLSAMVTAGCGWRGLNGFPLPGTAGQGPDSFVVEAQLPDVSHIEPNSRVQVGDVTVGNVRKISRQGWHALVTMTLDGDVHLPANATAKANLESVLKNKTVTQEKKDQVSSAVQGAESKPKDPQAAYNAARVYARLGDADQALTWLNKALELGYDQFDYLSLDPSLVNLKKDPRFLKLLEERRRAR